MANIATSGDAVKSSPHNYARISAAAKYLQIGRSTLYEWCRKRAHEGFPQPIKAGARVSLIDLNALDAFLEGQA